MTSYDDWRELAAQLRVDSIRATTQAGSGHPTSSLSAADLMAVLMAQHLRYDFANPRDPHNDHLVFSKGHASPLLYAMFKAAGAITDAELMSMRRAGSRLEGHPTPVLPWVEVATGSLGQGLAIGVGIALAGARLDRLPYRVWVLSGDSEMAEGSVWEAVEHAAHYRLANLTCIVDVNRLGQRGPTMLEWNTAAYAARARAFGWETLEIDGHDLRAIDDAYRRAAAASGAPMMILARTVKGKGVPAIENRDNWHGKALPKEDAEQAIAALGGRRSIVVDVRRPEDRRTSAKPPAGSLVLPSYKVGDSVATRRAYGDALRALGAARAEVVVLDGEVSNSTYADEFA
ncbi:MAG TPA: transketolase, partial [bacterium]|nr:transketolase [bacterium]